MHEEDAGEYRSGYERGFEQDYWDTEAADVVQMFSNQ